MGLYRKPLTKAFLCPITLSQDRLINVAKWNKVRQTRAQTAQIKEIGKFSVARIMSSKKTGHFYDIFLKGETYQDLRNIRYWNSFIENKEKSKIIWGDLL